MSQLHATARCSQFTASIGMVTDLFIPSIYASQQIYTSMLRVRPTGQQWKQKNRSLPGLEVLLRV